MNILIVGHGKMGRSIEELAQLKGHSVLTAVNSHEELRQTELSEVDVAIEFTGPGSAFGNISYLLEKGIPTVSGSTGWLEHSAEVGALCEKSKGAFFYASNYSIGVNIFFQVNKVLADLMEQFSDYDVLMREFHHTEKKDAPSGTAITLAEQIITRLGRKSQWGQGLGEGCTEQLSIESVRQDEVPGTHAVSYRSAVDTIEIKHTAHSRQGFAKGALTAAEWIIGRKGVFGMEDLMADTLSDA